MSHPSPVLWDCCNWGLQERCHRKAQDDYQNKGDAAFQLGCSSCPIPTPSPGSKEQTQPYHAQEQTHPALIPRTLRLPNLAFGENKIKVKPNQKKKPTHTQFVLFMFQESHIHSRHQSFCQLSLCFNLSSWASFLQEGKQIQHTGKLDVLSKIFIQAAQSN